MNQSKSSDSNRVVLVGVSGGPDSMALLDMLYREGKNLHVCHVNYHHRPTANRDQDIVAFWCQTHAIPLSVHDAGKEQGNFQDWARKERYDFFARTAKKIGADTIYLAHQMDDALETWIMQKERKSVPDFYGLKETSRYQSLIIQRPLLSRRKKDLEDYCKQNGIPYGIDESNLSDDYHRNYIRHHILEDLDSDQIIALAAKMRQDQKDLEERRKENEHIVQTTSSREWLQGRRAAELLSMMIFEHLQIRPGSAQAREMAQNLQLNKQVSISDWDLQLDGDQILAVKRKTYSPVLIHNRKELLKSPDLADWNLGVDEKGKTIESVFLKESDFPLTICPAEPGDEIAMRFGSKKLSRFFIDRKIARIMRSGWPVVKNRTGQVIFVPGLGCEKDHFSKTDALYVHFDLWNREMKRF